MIRVVSSYEITTLSERLTLKGVVLVERSSDQSDDPSERVKWRLAQGERIPILACLSSIIEQFC